MGFPFRIDPADSLLICEKTMKKESAAQLTLFSIFWKIE